ncbi:hypothetical protein [Pseudorhodoferax soli]|uniref:Uncharacterized protein n=1 Tax=Pseudorhodoferax soli TaxID=545864 RepID=A0A368XDT4_9BURK|nr:hypothetical protein [Pseudorhodoferax soli]RCW66110.1 hypothetical protein DES41_11168 [Pseudorhodoferax soli]
MPPRPVVHIHVDLLALQANFFRQLQHQLDVAKVLQVGCAHVSEQQVADQRDFGTFVPADGAQLAHEDARAQAQDWVLRGFLRDAIEATGLFLDECLQVCELLPLAVRTEENEAEIQRLLHELPLANHRLHFPQKLDKLRRQFGVSTRFDPHLLSINKARTCVVHRLGVTSPMDVDDKGALTITLHHVQFVLRGLDSGEETVFERAGMVTTERSSLGLRFVDRERSFQLGERVRLEARDMYDTIITLWRFGLEMAQAIERHGRSMGIEFPVETS